MNRSFSKLLIFALASICVFNPLAVQARGESAASISSHDLEEITQQKSAIMREILAEELPSEERWRWSIVLGILLVGHILSVWPASRIVAGSHGTFLRMLAFHGLACALFLGLLVFLGVAGFVSFEVFDSPGLFGLCFLVAAIVQLIATFRIPMRLFDIGFGGTLAFYLVLTVMCFLCDAAAWVAIPSGTPLGAAVKSLDGPAIEKWANEIDRKATAARLTPIFEKPTGASVAADSAPHDLVALYESLKKERETLNTNDPVSVGSYNRRAAEYKALRDAAAATPAPGS